MIVYVFHEILFHNGRVIVYFYLTLKAAITTAADAVLNIFSLFFSDKIMLDISCESSAWQRILMKHQALFSSKDKSKIYKSVVSCNFCSALKNRILFTFDLVYRFIFVASYLWGTV